MANRLDGKAIRWLDALDREGTLAPLEDGPLLDRFLSGPGAAGEAAFEILVRRHGPMVLTVCRGVLHDGHAADDAFQATFLVLARRASTVRGRDHLGPWLGRVARRIATRARAETRRRADRERLAALALRATSDAVDPEASEASALVREAVSRLPEADRRLLQLTYWQGKSYEEAADLLGCPIGTVRSRLSRIRDRLRVRLSRLGLVPAATAARPEAALVSQTVRAACSGGTTAAVAAGVVPASVAAMVDGGLSTMAILSWRSIAALVLVGGTIGVGTMAVRGSGGPTSPPQSSPATKPEPKPRPLLDNADIEQGKGDAPNAWRTGAEVAGVEYLWSREGHSGKGSLCLKKTAPRYFPIAQWSQSFDHRGQSPCLKVSAWIKAKDVTKVILDVQFVGSTRPSHAWAVYIGQKDPNDSPANHDWKRYEGVVKIAPGTSQIVVAPQIYGPGTVWFDDLAAEYTDAPAIDPTAR